jgi:EthD domain
MLKVMTLFVKRPDMTRRQFRDYYEGNHVAMGLAANKYFGFTKYVRNHVVAAHASPPARAFPEFDAFSEYTFKDVDVAVKAQEYMLTPGGKALAEDELNFLDMSYHPSFAVQETLIAGSPRVVEAGLRGKVAMVIARGDKVASADFQEFVRLTLDAALDTPAGRPPFDAILNLWTKPGAPEVPAEFGWSGATDSALVLELESIEAATETLGL